MEYFDLLDENGNSLGETKSREEVHRDGDWHKAVHIWIVNDNGDLIIQKRSKDKLTNPNMWTTSTSGHLSAGDIPINGAIRELEEEIGLFTDEESLEYLFTIKEHTIHNNGMLINNEIIDVFLINENIDITKLKLQVEEVSEVKYISYLEFEKMVNSNSPELVQHKELHQKLLETLHSRFD